MAHPTPVGGPAPAGRHPPVGVVTLLGGLTLAAGGLAYLYRHDPHRPDSRFPPCPFHAVTGLLCPGCGGLRMVHDLLHGDLAMAVRDNAMLLIGVPLLLAFVAARHRLRRPVPAVPVAVATLAVMLVWTIVRNIAGFPLVPGVS